jgi:hypothetical protein
MLRGHDVEDVAPLLLDECLLDGRMFAEEVAEDVTSFRGERLLKKLSLACLCMMHYSECVICGNHSGPASHPLNFCSHLIEYHMHPNCTVAVQHVMQFPGRVGFVCT